MKMSRRPDNAVRWRCVFFQQRYRKYDTTFGNGVVDVQNHFVLMSMLAEKWQK